MKSTVGQGAASVDLKHYSQKKRYNNRRTLVLAIKGRREVIVIREQRHYITRIFWDPPPLYCLIVLLPILSTVLYPDGTYLARAQYGLFRCVLMFGKGRQGGFCLLHFLPSSAALTTNWCHSGPIHLPSYLLGQTY